MARRKTLQDLKFMGAYGVRSARVNRPDGYKITITYYLDVAPRAYNIHLFNPSQDETLAYYLRLDEFTATAVLHHLWHGDLTLLKE